MTDAKIFVPPNNSEPTPIASPSKLSRQMNQVSEERVASAAEDASASQSSVANLPTSADSQLTSNNQHCSDDVVQVCRCYYFFTLANQNLPVAISSLKLLHNQPIMHQAKATQSETNFGSTGTKYTPIASLKPTMNL